MLIDSHVHYDYNGKIEDVKRALEITKADFLCLQSQIYTKKINQNIDDLYVKLKLNGKIYVNGAMDSLLYYNQDMMDEMPAYLDRMFKCGIDGIKMIEGKPTERKIFPIPDFDKPCYDATFKYLEDNKINITWHVNDPEEFWVDELCPDWAKRSGWFYGDGTYINNEKQYKQIENLLSRHPNLRITFAHFFFKSNELDYLSDLFDKFPYVGVDITPGVELFTNMSNNIDKAKAFFKKYANRIMYGTDISIGPGYYDEDDAVQRKNLCHDFLTKDRILIKGNPNGLLGKDDFYLNCLSLDNDLVELIEYKNFLNKYGEPKPLNIKLILEEIKIHKDKLIELDKDYKYLLELEEEFKKYE